MANYDVWMSNNPSENFSIYEGYYDTGYNWGLYNQIGSILPFEIYFFVDEIPYPGDPYFRIHRIIFRNSGIWKWGYINAQAIINSTPQSVLDGGVANIGPLEDRLVCKYGQYYNINGKRLVWAKTNTFVDIYDGGANYVMTLDPSIKVTLDVNTHGTFQCGNSHRDWITLTHWYDPTQGWRYLKDGGSVCFGAIDMHKYNEYKINVI